MPTTYTPSIVSNPTTFTVPADGDNANVSSILSPLEALMDKTSFLGNLYKFYFVGSSTTLLNATITTSATPLITVALPTFGLLATDVIVAVGSLYLGSSGLTTTISSAVTYSGGTRAADSVIVNSLNCPYVWSGSVAASAGATAFTISATAPSGTQSATAARLFLAILRQG